MDHIFVMDATKCMMHDANKNIVNLKILLLFMLKKSVYRIFFLFMSKHEAEKLMTNSTLIDKNGVL